MATNKYALLVRVAELKNLTAVANELGYTQSAVSYAIQSLENELGIPLIRRTRTGVSLTTYAEELLPDFRQIVSSEELLFQKAGEYQGLRRGTLRVGAFTSVSLHWIPYIAKKISDEYPDVRLIQSHLLYDGITDGLNNGTIDIGFISEVDKGSLDFFPLYKDEYFVAIPPDHPLARYERIPVEALDNERIILMVDGGKGIEQIIKQINNPQIVHYVSEEFLALPLAEQGIGISIIPGMIAQSFHSKVVIRRFAEPRYRVIGLAAKSVKDAPPLASLFLKLLQEYLSEWSLDDSTSWDLV